MADCCDICGDPGVLYALVTCDRCKSSCEHLYCMRTFCMDHPESWYCEKCEELYPSSSLNTRVKLQCDSTYINNLPNDLRRNSMDPEKKIKTGNVKPLSPQEVIKLASGAQKSSSVVKTSFQSSTILRKRRSLLERTRGIPPKFDSQWVTRNPFLELPKQLRPQIAWQVGQSSRGLREKDTVQSLLKHTYKEYIQKGQPMNATEDNAASKRAQITAGNPAKDASPLRDDQPTVNSGYLNVFPEKDDTRPPLEKRIGSQKAFVQKGQPVNIIISNAEKKRAQIAVEKETIASITTSPLRIDQPIGFVVSSNMRILTADPRSVSPLHAPPEVGKGFYIPAYDASWEGSFNVFLSGPKHQKVSFGIQAHPPSRGRKKIDEALKLMPEVLKFELVQRGSLWMSLFGNYSPDRRDIGLYFFPSTHERYNYTLLLEHIGEHDLVLRNFRDGLQLLIFTSKILHIDYQKWDGMYFFWGVFHRIKLTITSLQVETNQRLDGGNGNEAVDMEIDKRGGHNVGRLDIAVPRKPLQLPSAKDARETFSNIPPGFERTYRPQVQASYSSAAKSKFGVCVKVERDDEGNVGRLDAAVPRIPLRLPPRNQAQETFPIIPPGFEKIHRPQAQTLHSSAAKSETGACVKVERLDEKNVKSEFQ